MSSSLTPFPLDVLVSTRRVVQRFAELRPEEVADLFHCAHRLAPVLQQEFKGTSLTISVQVRRAGGTMKEREVLKGEEKREERGGRFH